MIFCSTLEEAIEKVCEIYGCNLFYKSNFVNFLRENEYLKQTEKGFEFDESMDLDEMNSQFLEYLESV